MDETDSPATESDVLSRMSQHFGEPEKEPEETEQAEAAPEVDAEDTEATEETEEATPDAGLVEIETDDGEKYQVPTKLKDSFLRQKDYTQKTQELAELRKQAAVALQHQQVISQFEKVIEPEKAELGRIDADLAKYKQLDWGQLDVETYIKARHQMDTLKERAGELKQAIGQKYEGLKQWREKSVQEVTKSATQYLSQAIPNWGPAAQADARQQAIELGYTEDEMAEVYDPRFVRLAWKAAQFDKIQAGKPAAVAKANAAPPVIKPGVSTGQSAAKESQYKQQREKFRKSGDVRDAAKLLLMR
jgi:hypothetical protein